MSRRKTHKEFVEEIKIKNDNIIVIGDYINAKEPIKFKCLICENEWRAQPTNILNGQGCPKCGRERVAKKNRKTLEEFINDLNNKNKSIEILSKVYINSSSYMICRCKIDGYEWRARAGNLLTGYGCPKCYESRRGKDKLITHEEFLTNLQMRNKKFKMGCFSIESKYESFNNNLRCKCNKHHFEWEVSPTSLYNGSGCPKCSKVYRLNNKEFVERLGELQPNLTLISKYERMNKKLKFLCKVCLNEFEMTGSTLCNGQGCPKCGRERASKSKIKTHDKFITELAKKNPYIEVLGDYKRAREKVQCKCKKCNKTWLATPHKLLLNKGNTGCPNCNRSNGELEIEKYCLKNNYEYKTQFKIKNCKNINALPFDFALFNKSELITLIEYQGKQHYMPVEFFGGEENFKKQQRRDEIKKNYCNSNDINLIEIPYWIDDIEGYLEERIDLIGQPIQLSLV